MNPHSQSHLTPHEQGHLKRYRKRAAACYRRYARSNQASQPRKRSKHLNQFIIWDKKAFTLFFK
jgi:hypothetical protein